jgi:hypothetical protein
VLAVLIALIATEPRTTLVILAYSYLLSAPIGWAMSRVKRSQA